MEAVQIPVRHAFLNDFGACGGATFLLKVRGAMRTFRVKSPPWAIFGEMGELLGDGFRRGMGGCFVELGGKPR